MYFDQPYYLKINEARWAVADKILDRLPSGIQTCLDAGCGPGWFTDRLIKKGYTVTGVEGRKELADEAQRRVPNANFEIADITSSDAHLALPVTDLVFCFGLIYHLENPFAAIRTLFKITGEYLFIETQVAPSDKAHFVLVSEGINETQGLTYHAVIPTRAALVKMLYVAGFSSVYRYTGHVNHDDFVDTRERIHRREIFLASKSPIQINDMQLESEPVTSKINYNIEHCI